MNELFSRFRGALMLDAKTFADLKASPDVFRKGFTFVLVVGLLVGLLIGLIGLPRLLLANPAEEMRTARTEIERSLATMPMGESASMVLENIRMGFAIAERVMQLQAPLPRSAEVIFRQIGFVVSYPFGWLGSLILYGALVHVFAKLLGGRGTIAQMYGLTSLAAASSALNVLNALLSYASAVGGCLSFPVSLIAFVWGVVIYVKGTATAQEMSTGRALLAVLMPIIVAFLFVLLLLLLLGVVITVTSGGGR